MYINMSEFAKNVLGFRKVHISSTEAISFPTLQSSGGVDIPLPTQFSFNMPSVNTPPQTSCLGAIAVFTGGSINCSTGIDVAGGNIPVGQEEFMRVSPIVNVEVAGWSNQNYYRPTLAGNTSMVATFDAETSLLDAVNIDNITKSGLISTQVNNATGNTIPVGTTNGTTFQVADATNEQGQFYDNIASVPMESSAGAGNTLYQRQPTIAQLDTTTRQTWGNVSSVHGNNLEFDGLPQSIKLKPLTNTQSWRTGVCVGNPFSKQITCSVFLQQGYQTNIVADATKNSATYQQRDLVGLNQSFSNGAGGTTATRPVDSIASVDLYFDFLLYDMDRISGDKLQALLI